MTSLNVAVVSRDPSVRLAAARAFDEAPSSWKVRLHDAAPRDADVLVFGADLRDQASGQILFDPARDGNVIEHVRRSVAAARCKAFVVTGAGRGVGVTSLALHLASASASERSTCYLDLDLEWGAASRLGIDGEHRSWAGLADDEDEVGIVALPVAGGFKALLAPEKVPSAARLGESLDERSVQEVSGAGGFGGLRVARPTVTPARAQQPALQDVSEVARLAAGADSEAARVALRAAVKVFERVVIDCPAGALLDAVLDDVDAAVLVMPPTLPAARRATRILERHDAASWAIVLNRTGPGGETTRAELHRLLRRRAALELPCSPSLRDAEDDSRLLTSSWTRYVGGVDRLLRALESAP